MYVTVDKFVQRKLSRIQNILRKKKYLIAKILYRDTHEIVHFCFLSILQMLYATAKRPNNLMFRGRHKNESYVRDKCVI